MKTKKKFIVTLFIIMAVITMSGSGQNISKLDLEKDIIYQKIDMEDYINGINIEYDELKKQYDNHYIAFEGVVSAYDTKNKWVEISCSSYRIAINYKKKIDFTDDYCGKSFVILGKLAVKSGKKNSIEVEENLIFESTGNEFAYVKAESGKTLKYYDTKEKYTRKSLNISTTDSKEKINYYIPTDWNQYEFTKNDDVFKDVMTEKLPGVFYYVDNELVCIQYFREFGNLSDDDIGATESIEKAIIDNICDIKDGYKTGLSTRIDKVNADFGSYNIFSNQFYNNRIEMAFIPVKNNGTEEGLILITYVSGKSDLKLLSDVLLLIRTIEKTH